MKNALFCLFIFICVSLAKAVTITVSQDGTGDHTTIQSAIDAAAPGDEVVILDNGVYEEQVTIDSISGITLKSQSEAKPTILYHDEEHIHPTSGEEAEQKVVDYDQNGALRIMHARNITIEGIKVDGGGAFTFGANEVWGFSAFQHGNTAITVWSAGNAVIRNCDISNAFIGIYIKDNGNGGIFGNPDPHERTRWNFEGFGQDGNHLLERNRIHDNSWGLFVETLWDLGSTVRYNLFYNNHHYSDEFAEKVYNLTDDGTNHAGGAICFKNCTLSPLAIYNNTFWHNYLLFAGQWQAGSQHLIFNNICAQTYRYWDVDTLFRNPYYAMDPVFENRMHHSIYSAQKEAPDTRQSDHLILITDPQTGEYVKTKQTIEYVQWVQIMNHMPPFKEGYYELGQTFTFTTKTPSGEVVESEIFADMAIPPGALIIDPFPQEASIRWLECDFRDESKGIVYELFKSTDPQDPDFLVPDWDDSLVQKFIIDKGWPSAGILDADGSIADLGAFSSAGVPNLDARITPLSPVSINGTDATVHFSLSAEGTFDNPQIKFFRLINEIPYESNSMGPDIPPVPETDIIEMPVDQPVSLGGNIVSVTVPERDVSNEYAFFEIVIEGTDAEGNKITTNVGFLPYRQFSSRMDVTILDKDGSTELNSVKVGDTVQIRIEAVEMIEGEEIPLGEKISPVVLSLSSGATMINIEGNELLIDSIDGSITVQGIFTKVPEDGSENLIVSGFCASEAIFGTSDMINIEPGTITSSKPTVRPKVIRNTDMHFSLYSVNGRLIYKSTAGSFAEFTLKAKRNRIGKGLYLIRMHDSNGRLIKNRRINALQ